MQSSLMSFIDRRSFLSRLSMFAVALPLVEIGSMGLLGCTARSKNAHGVLAANVPSETVLVTADEPGEPLIISGTIYAPDGRKPMPGINLFVYHTDATGRYSNVIGDNRKTRIHGLMRSDAQGHYQFRTIKPAPYPGHTNPAHIHAYVSGPGYPEYWIDLYLFDGDPFITPDLIGKEKSKGNFSSILALTRGADGILRGRRDIRVERCTNNCVGS